MIIFCDIDGVLYRPEDESCVVGFQRENAFRMEKIAALKERMDRQEAETLHLKPIDISLSEGQLQAGRERVSRAIIDYVKDPSTSKLEGFKS